MPDSREPQPDGNGGGPVKTFLEHLEDLRWLLVKSGAALLVCLIVCLYATPTIVWILKRPLSQAALVRVGNERRAVMRFGDETVATFQLQTNRLGPIELGENWMSVV